MATFETSEHFKNLFPYMMLPKQVATIIKHDSINKYFTFFLQK